MRSPVSQWVSGSVSKWVMFSDIASTKLASLFAKRFVSLFIPSQIRRGGMDMSELMRQTFHLVL